MNNITIKSSGCIKAGDVFAKQFHGRGNLRLLGDWFHHINAIIGNKVEIRWTSPTDFIIIKL